jgi:hypothetical protein
MLPDDKRKELANKLYATWSPIQPAKPMKFASASDSAWLRVADAAAEWLGAELVDSALGDIEERAYRGDRHGSPAEKHRAEGMREAVRTLRVWMRASKPKEE